MWALVRPVKISFRSAVSPVNLSFFNLLKLAKFQFKSWNWLSMLISSTFYMYCPRLIINIIVLQSYRFITLIVLYPLFIWPFCVLRNLKFFIVSILIFLIFCKTENMKLCATFIWSGSKFTSFSLSKRTYSKFWVSKVLSSIFDPFRIS